MNSRRIKVVLGILITVFIFLGLGRIYYLQTKRAENKIRIAINLPLSGPIADFMGPYPDALRMGLEDGYRDAGKPIDAFTLDIQDNAGNPSQAIAIAQQQSAQGFGIYISGSSEMCTAVMPIVHQVGAPHFLIAFDAYMTSKCPTCLRILPSYKAEGPLWVEYVKQRHAKRVALLTLNNAPIEEEFDKIVEPGLSSIGVASMRERFEWTGSDYRTLALKVAAFHPDAILVNGYSVHLYPIISALRSLELIHDHNVLASMDFDDLLYNGTPKQDLDGVAFITPQFEVEHSDKLEQWKHKYDARFHKRASWVAAYAYDTGFVIATASVGKSKVTKQDIESVLPRQGIAGELTLDKDGDLGSTLVLAMLDSKGNPIKFTP